ILLSEIPKSPLDYSLYLINRLSEIVGEDLDLLILNIAPPMLKYQVIKYGKLLFSRSERVRVMFEVKALKEYLDLSRVLERYNKCLMDQLLA
ncbi:MAG: nucleotidyltransferase domain-containing protein, partial [Nitrososphaeria archaeon]